MITWCSFYNLMGKGTGGRAERTEGAEGDYITLHMDADGEVFNQILHMDTVIP